MLAPPCSPIRAIATGPTVAAGPAAGPPCLGEQQHPIGSIPTRQDCRPYPVPDCSGFVIGLMRDRSFQEATMDRLTRVTQQSEKPGRLQLAIVEWQRQLIEKRGHESPNRTDLKRRKAKADST